MQVTVKQNKYATARIKGASKRKAALVAGAKTPKAADKYAERMSKNVAVQKLIDDALAMHELTPEMAVGELKKIVVQDEELGAKRLAIKDTLELHGWKRGDKPTVVLDVKQAWFSEARPSSIKIDPEPIDA